MLHTIISTIAHSGEFHNAVRPPTTPSEITATIANPQNGENRRTQKMPKITVPHRLPAKVQRIACNGGRSVEQQSDLLPQGNEHDRVKEENRDDRDIVEQKGSVRAKTCFRVGGGSNQLRRETSP